MKCFSYIVVVAPLVLSFSTFVSATELSDALEILRAVEANAESQLEVQKAWKTVASAGADQLPQILEAMQGADPVAENWLRTAVDTIADRELESSNSLPAEDLQNFLLDKAQSKRARRTAYVWLSRVDKTVPERLLPMLVDDPSLEIRYDAVAHAMSKASTSGSDAAKLKQYQRVLGFARDKSQILECVAAVKELGHTIELAKHFGYVTDWQVIGPFDNTGGKGLDVVYPPEEQIDFSKTFSGKEGEVAWKEYHSDHTKFEKLGLVDFNKLVDEQKEVVAYAAATFVADSGQQAQCRFGSKNATKLWVNGKLVATNRVYHSGFYFDQYVAPIQLRAGKNQILIKVCQNEQTQSWARDWGLQLRVTDMLGGAINHAW